MIWQVDPPVEIPARAEGPLTPRGEDLPSALARAPGVGPGISNSASGAPLAGLSLPQPRRIAEDRGSRGAPSEEMSTPARVPPRMPSHLPGLATRTPPPAPPSNIVSASMAGERTSGFEEVPSIPRPLGYRVPPFGPPPGELWGRDAPPPDPSWRFNDGAAGEGEDIGFRRQDHFDPFATEPPGDRQSMQPARLSSAAPEIGPGADVPAPFAPRPACFPEARSRRVPDSDPDTSAPFPPLAACFQRDPGGDQPTSSRVWPPQSRGDAVSGSEPRVSLLRDPVRSPLEVSEGSPGVPQHKREFRGGVFEERAVSQSCAPNSDPAVSHSTPQPEVEPDRVASLAAQEQSASEFIPVCCSQNLTFLFSPLSFHTH